MAILSRSAVQLNFQSFWDGRTCIGQNIVMWNTGRTKKHVIKFLLSLSGLTLLYLSLIQPRTRLCKLQALNFFFLSFNTVIQFIRDNCFYGTCTSFFSLSFKQCWRRNLRAPIFTILLFLFTLIVSLSKQLNNIYKQVFCVSANE